MTFGFVEEQPVRMSSSVESVSDSLFGGMSRGGFGLRCAFPLSR